MKEPRPVFTLRGLFILAVLATGWWLFQSGQWEPLSARLQAGIESATGYRLPMPWLPEDSAPAVPAPAAPAESTPPPAPVQVVSWVDANGVRQYGTAARAPAGAVPVTLRPEASMADYEAAVQAEMGVTAEQIAQARARIAAAGSSSEQRVAADMQAGRDHTSQAIAQAYELLDRYEATLESIRQENRSDN
jgi:hypothetical protein